jgi:fatty acid hydroxylase domain-containing protein 2
MYTPVMLPSLPPVFAEAWARFVVTYADYNLPVFGSWALMMLTYWGFGGFMLFVDIYHWPNWMWRRKYQPERAYTSNGSTYNPPLYRVIGVVLFNQCCVFLPGLWAMQWFFTRVDLLPWRTGVRASPELPSLLEVVVTFGIALVVEEPLFYYSHKLLHWRVLYKRIHKMHHAYHAPHSLASLYAHPLEALFCNLLAMNLPLFICNFHLLTCFVAIVLGWASSLVGHCGYEIPVLSWMVPKGNFHDLHHEHSTGNYGTAGWLDRLVGTDIKASEPSKETRV